MSAKNFRRVPDGKSAEGFIIPGYSAWDCEKCGSEVAHYRGMREVNCPDCGTPYNAGGQRLRDNWRDNPSNYDDNIGDMEGYEMECLSREY